MGEKETIPIFITDGLLCRENFEHFVKDHSMRGVIQKSLSQTIKRSAHLRKFLIVNDNFGRIFP